MKTYDIIMYHLNAALCVTNVMLFMYSTMWEFAVYAVINLVCALIARNNVISEDKRQGQ